MITENSWDFLKQYTNARIAIGRVGNGIPTSELLQFRLAHACAKDAVMAEGRFEECANGLKQLGLDIITINSQANDKSVYLRRPDLGRKLAEESAEILKNRNDGEAELGIVLADGLSAAAAGIYGRELISHWLPLLKKDNLRWSPVSLVHFGRVAIGDEIGYLLGLKLVVVLIGERPGLSAAESLGAYITFTPKPGTTDESRNCISNIRPQGLPIKEAVLMLHELCKTALQKKMTGVELKFDRLG